MRGRDAADYQDSGAADLAVDEARIAKAQAEEARRSTDLYLAVERALSEKERADFLAEMVRRDPRWDGAKVADVLAILDDSDAFVGEWEDFYESESDLFEGATPVGLNRAAFLVTVVLEDEPFEWRGRLCSIRTRVR